MTQQAQVALIAAPASGQGKTTVTAALALALRQLGKRVKVFKCGPDFLDPKLLELASGTDVNPLDLWMLGEDGCRAALYDAASSADVILVEGVMGLYDGTPSAADLAKRFGLPVLAVIDGSGMAQTFAAIAHGLATFTPDLPFAGVIANRTGSAGHGKWLKMALPDHLPWFGALQRQPDTIWPERDLGLVDPADVDDGLTRLQGMADDLKACLAERDLPTVTFEQPATLPELPSLAGVRIGIAQDEAFRHVYPANIALLEKMGAEYYSFSPLRDTALPEVDVVYLPGGPLENHLAQLADNSPMLAALRAHHRAGKPILAEGTGSTYCLEVVSDQQGKAHELLGILAGSGSFQPKRVALGLQELACEQGVLRGHSFHRVLTDMTENPAKLGHSPVNSALAEPLYQSGRLTASLIQSYWPSHPQLVARWLTP